MEKKIKGETTQPASLVFFPAMSENLVPPMPEPDRTARAAAGIPRPVAGAPAFIAVRDLNEARHVFEELEHEPLTVRQIAAALDADARRLAGLYQRRITQASAEGHPEPEAAVLVPLMEYLGAGVHVSDVHKLLNVARDPLFEQTRAMHGKTAARRFQLEQAIALYVIWRLGHSFHLAPGVRKSIACRFTQNVLWKVIQGTQMGLAVTPFVAIIAELDELMDMGHTEVVAFSLNGLVCQALHAFHPEPH
ncbi:MAG: hypothetical protein V3U11_03435 [Planctomycetota bacterium]